MTKPRVIAFEGVDGAGKSTVINKVAKWLKKNGESVYMPRIGKEHSSRPTRMIRRLTRDQHNLALCGRPEMLLYCAREAQILEELVAPAVARGQTVLLDRSVLTPVVLGAWGRGVSREDCEAAARIASNGQEPDLTLVFDVHPRTSRIRKRLDKVRTQAKDTEGGRKGLAGSGLKERVRDGYLAVAKERGYPLFHVERASPDEMAQRVIRVIKGGALEQSEADATPTWQVDPDWDFEQALAAQPEAVALYMTRGLVAGRERRRQAAQANPRLAAWGMDREDPLREELAERDPSHALSSWHGRPLESADDLRERLADRFSETVVRSLKGVEGARADALRTRMAASHPGAVVDSLLGREDAWAWELRRALWDSANINERAHSITGCSCDAANRYRDEIFEEMPTVGLSTLRRVDPAIADPHLLMWIDKAPKRVLGALTGRSDDAAHEMRGKLIEVGREVIDTVRGLDCPKSWDLRRSLASRWPSTVLWSLAGTPEEQNRRELTELCTLAGRGDLHFLRRKVALEEFVNWPDWTRSRRYPVGFQYE